MKWNPLESSQFLEVPIHITTVPGQRQTRAANKQIKETLADWCRNLLDNPVAALGQHVVMHGTNYSGIWIHDSSDSGKDTKYTHYSWELLPKGKKKDAGKAIIQDIFQSKSFEGYLQRAHSTMLVSSPAKFF